MKEFIKKTILPIQSKSGYEYKDKYWKTHYPNELKQLYDLTSFLDEEYQKVYIKQRIWHILNNKLELQYCPVCKIKLLKWHNSLKSYAQTCSSKCTKQLKSYQEKIKQTNLKKYGVEYSWQAKDVKEKIKQTNLKKYGVEYISQTKQFKEQLRKNNPMFKEENKQKIKQTNLEKYGVEFPLQNDKIKQKIKQTNLEKYGVNHIYQQHFKHYEEYKSLTKEKIIEKFVDEKGLFKNKEFQEYFNVSFSFIQKLKKKFNLEEFPNKFSLEFEVFNWIPINKKIRNNRKIIKPLELDMFIPDYNLAIEFNGVFWHSQKFKDKNYHQNKSKMCLDKNIQLLQIYDYEWLDDIKRRIWKSIILYKLKMLKRKYYARKLKIKELKSNEIKDFLNKNHLQGFISSKINIGLFDNNELVSVMTFSKPRFNKNYDWEMIRFANKKYTICVGCASKMFNYFKKKYKGKIISYANLRWSNGNLYKQLGFKFEDFTIPNYFYFKKQKIFSRIQCQKHKLKDILDTFDKNKSEFQNMFDNGFSIFYDSGNLKFIF